ncbi:MAG: hypothetical protein HY234_02380 [Acidobacteria bacterium]|nr:hypothetical protein [Acidobacteriota bacterium]
MAKKQTFADKVKKERGGSICPVCGGATQPVKLVRPEQDATSGAWKFRTRMVVVCKCNQKSVYD